MTRTIAIFIGTRPEAIKMAPIVAALRQEPGLRPLVISTGQHREMLTPLLDLFQISVDVELAAMEPSQTLAGLSAKLLLRMDEAIAATSPDYALVQGDTTSAMCGALACFYRGVAVGHVEAGLRTGNLREPFPEEGNRRIISPLASLHFAPTETARQALLAEQIADDRIVVTGNTVVDALLLELERQRHAAIQSKIHDSLAEKIGDDWSRRTVILVTGHRRENFGAGFEEICTALDRLAALQPATLVVYPVHLNPRVREVVERRLAGRENIRLTPPLAYPEFVALLAVCKLALTDSGGVQEEAPTLGKPVLVMRNTTERPEGVAAGGVLLVGAKADCIVAETSRLLADEDVYQRMAQSRNPYGDGKAAKRIVDRIRLAIGM
jgi:UDP-N-acetylglucosamine 2-epimerase (non-hydrolysing)